MSHTNIARIQLLASPLLMLVLFVLALRLWGRDEIAAAATLPLWVGSFIHWLRREA